MKPDFREHFRAGVGHFNALEFWEAHESWETIWLVAESDVEQFLQGLIQLAAAYHHMRRGTFRGAVRLFEAASRRLEPYPDPWCGIERRGAVEAAHKHRAWAEARLAEGNGDARLPESSYPKLIADEKSMIPPRDAW